MLSTNQLCCCARASRLLGAVRNVNWELLDCKEWFEFRRRTDFVLFTHKDYHSAQEKTIKVNSRLQFMSYFYDHSVPKKVFISFNCAVVCKSIFSNFSKSCIIFIIVRLHSKWIFFRNFLCMQYTCLYPKKLIIFVGHGLTFIAR